MRRTAAAVCVLLLAAPWNGMAALAIDAPAEPDGYRMEAYRSPVPATLAGATVISTEEARRLWADERAIFVDVMPRPPKPENLPEDVIWRDPPRHNIPDSIWLPNVGFGALNPEMDAYFRSNLSQLAKDGADTRFVFYCLADCWMSWNAAKRALEYGYTAVYWYPEGTDGWVFEGGDLAPSEPLPMTP